MQLGICCSPLQHRFAAALATRLAQNLGIATLIVDDAEPLSATWEQASASDAVLLILDRVSAPGPVRRGDWQSLLERTVTPPLATLRVEDCHYPKLLERSRFLVPANELEAERWVERWLVNLLAARVERAYPELPSKFIEAGGAPPLDAWWAQTVDQPGVLRLATSEIDTAQTFAAQAAAHFQEVFWIGCEGVPPDALAGEIGFRAALGTRFLFIVVGAELAIELSSATRMRHSFLILEGAPAVLQAAAGNRLGQWIGACRASGFPASLLDRLLDEVSLESTHPLLTRLSANKWFRPQGRMETTAHARERHFWVLHEVFRLWRRQPAQCLELVGEAAWALCQRGHLALPGAAELCLDLAQFLLSEKRLVEAVTWFRIVASADETSDSSEFVRTARSELSWLVDECGEFRPRQTERGDQVRFDFPGFHHHQTPVDRTEEEALLEQLQHAARNTRVGSGVKPAQLDLFG